MIVRRARIADAPPMAELLNAIIAQGETTALSEQVNGAELTNWMCRRPERSAWHIAEEPGEWCLGFQWIEPAGHLPEEAAEIATFVKIGETGRGIGSELFSSTKEAARNLGYKWINANIRADNASGLAYYSSLGFRDYDRKYAVRLGNGRTVDKVLKRYDLPPRSGQFRNST